MNCIYPSRININFDQLLEKTTSHQLNNSHFKWIRHIQNLQDPTETVSYFERFGKKTRKIHVIGNRTYIQKNQIGEGTFKTVYSGKSITGEKVAILEMSIENEQQRRAVQRELNILQALQKIEGVVRFKAVGTQQDKKIIIQELCEEGTLHAHLGKCTLAEKIDISIQILKAINALHKAKVIYGDLKPENILLKRDSENKKFLIRFGDFGGSYQIGSIPLVGSLYYMSPERLIWMKVSNNNEQLKGNLQIEAEICDIGLVLLNLFVAEDYREQPFPWCNEIDEFFLAKIEELEERYTCLKDTMTSDLAEMETIIETYNNDTEADICKMILTMLNIEHPNQRPSLDIMIQAFETYANV